MSFIVEVLLELVMFLGGLMIFFFFFPQSECFAVNPFSEKQLESKVKVPLRARSFLKETKISLLRY